MSATATDTPTKREITPEHKAAMARGRDMGRHVKAYLSALENHKPRRGRKADHKRTIEKVELALADESTSPVERVRLIQMRLDAEKALAAEENTADITSLETEFVKVAKDYSESKGLTYDAWRQVGVTPDVLKKAGISR